MSAELSCSLAGYVEMVDEILSLALIAVTVNASIIEAVISGLPDLAHAFGLLV